MEHLQHFGLNDDPFRKDPLERYQLDVPCQQHALLRVDRGVRQSRSLILLTGEIGSGKSTVLRKLYEELEEELFEASMMMVLRGSVDADWLLRRFATQLGVEDLPVEREALVGQIYERLAIVREDGRHAVLIIDDAHALAAHGTLRELFALVKLEYEDRRLLTVVLAGVPRLGEVIDADAELMRQVEVRHALASFSPAETAGYLTQRVQVAGGDARMLLPGAMAALHERAHGCPGRLNTLADNALFESFLVGRTQVDAADVERASADLHWGDERVAVATAAPQLGPGREADDLPPAPREARAMRAPQAAAPLAPAAPDLDSELEAVFEPEAALPEADPEKVLFDFETGEAPPLPAEGFPSPQELQLEVLDAPPKEADEVDDLFMELLDD